MLVSVLVLQNVVTFSVNLTDNVMLGRFSQVALSGAAAVNQIQFILQQVTFGIGEGLVVLASQYWGQRQTESIKRIISIAFWCGILTGAILFALASAIPYRLLSLFTPDQAIIVEGMKYLNVMRYTYLIFIITNVLLSGLRSAETVKIAFYISISTFIINAFINYVLIYGNFGAPRLGSVGSALSTLCARIIELIAVIVYLGVYDKKLHLKFRDFLHIDRVLLVDFLHVCMPVVVTYGLFGLSTALQTVILGHMDSDAIAANSVATTSYQVLKTVSTGAASATAVIIAETVGSGRLEKIREYSRTLQLLYVLIGIFTSIVLFAMRPPLLSFYSLTPNARSLSNAFLLVLCVTCIGTAYQMPALSGIVRGGGDTKFVLINDLISIWGIVLPASFLAAFVFHLNPVIVVALLNSDQVFKCGAAAIKVNRYKWIKVLARKEEIKSP